MSDETRAAIAERERITRGDPPPKKTKKEQEPAPEPDAGEEPA